MAGSRRLIHLACRMSRAACAGATRTVLDSRGGPALARELRSQAGAQLPSCTGECSFCKLTKKRTSKDANAGSILICSSLCRCTTAGQQPAHTTLCVRSRPGSSSTRHGAALSPC